MKRTRRTPIKVSLSQKERLSIMNELHKRTRLQIPIDGLISAATSEIHIDLFRLEKNIPNYDGKNCLYKGKPNYSMKMALEEEYGIDVSEMIFKLI